MKNKQLQEEKGRNTQKSSPNEDDHSTHKSKVTSRQRSHSKDSNDGFTHPNMQSLFSQGDSKVVTQSESNNETNTTTHCNSPQNQMKNSSLDEHQNYKLENKLLNSTQPVMIDQILTGSELDLKSFMGENRNDPVVSSIELSLGTETRTPKVAANIFEAKHLMTIRKQIELNNQKNLGKSLSLCTCECYIY